MTEPLRERTRAVVELYLDALNRHDPDAAAGCVSDDFFNEHTSALGHSLRGQAAYRERLPGFLAQFRALHYEAEDWIVDTDRCAVPYRMSCTYLDGDGTAHPVQIRGIFRFRVENDAIVHRVDYWDGNEFARQVRLEGAK
jgi:predicted ester cyclase